MGEAITRAHDACTQEEKLNKGSCGHQPQGGLGLWALPGPHSQEIALPVLKRASNWAFIIIWELEVLHLSHT